MSFKDFAANIQSIRDYEPKCLKEMLLADITAYLNEINTGIGREKGFSLVMLEDGETVFNSLKGLGGYSGMMIKSPHYIGLVFSKADPEADFYGAYYMQSVVKKLYDMLLGSCWINIGSVPGDYKLNVLKGSEGTLRYMLAFGETDEKAVARKAHHTAITSASSAFEQDPYGLITYEAETFDKARYSLGEVVYLYEWGRHAAYEELESRGMAEIFEYIRNAPSYKNMQPCRVILKDGEAELVLAPSENKSGYIDAGIMMYVLEGLVKDMGIPGKWHFVGDESDSKGYSIAARIEL